MFESRGDVLTSLKILYVAGETICFQIDHDTYFLKTEGIACLYDNKGKKLNITNIDYWISNRTKKQYSYKYLIDMAIAFKMGMEIGYKHEDVIDLIRKSVKMTINEIMRKGNLHQYSLLYWIEILGEKKIEKYLEYIRKNIEDVKKNIGINILTNNLLRFYKVALYRQSKCLHVVEEIIERIDEEIVEPIYPESREIDNVIIEAVSSLFDKDSGTTIKAIDEVIRIAKKLNK